MSHVLKLPQAQEDLLEIWLRIASDNVLYADHFLDFLDEKMRLLAIWAASIRSWPRTYAASPPTIT